jgi:hypothetical protein
MLLRASSLTYVGASLDTYIFWCDKCNRRFSCDPPETKEGDRDTLRAVLCPDCSGAKAPRRSTGRLHANLRASQTAIAPARLSSKEPRAPQPSAVSSTRSTPPTNTGKGMSGLTIGLIGTGVVGLLLILLFSLGGSKPAEKTAGRSEVSTADAGAGASKVAQVPPTTESRPPIASDTKPLPADPAPSTVADAESRARAAFDLLESKLRQLPESEKDARRALCDAFLREHDNTIIAARVRTMSSSPGGPARVPSSAGTISAGGRSIAHLGLKDFEGGEIYQNFTGKGMDGRAVWGLRTDTHTMTAKLKVDVVPAGSLSLEIRSLRHELSVPATIRISLNGSILYEGRDKNTEQKWQVNAYELSDGLVKEGENPLEIVCTEDSDIKHRAPWFMLNELNLVSRLAGPRLPDVHLSDLKAIKATCGYNGVQNDGCCWNGDPLRLTGVVYAKGLGVHSPSEVVYDLVSEYKRFVGRLGFHDRPDQKGKGSVIGRVLIDGKAMRDTALFRGGDPDVDFDVAIPPGSKQIALVVNDAGDGSDWDLVDWVNVGFLLKE